MFGLQPTHLILIIVIALLLFGPSRLPEIGKAMGKTITEFKAGIKDVQSGLDPTTETKDEKKPQA